MKKEHFERSPRKNSEDVRYRYFLLDEGGERVGEFERIDESQSLSEVWQHASKGLATLSAFRSERSESENFGLHEELKKILRSYGLGFWEVDGVYQDEIYQTSSGEYNPESPSDEELSLFVPYREEMFRDFADFIADIGLNRPFNQDSVLVAYPETEGGAVVLRYKGKDVKIGNNVAAGKISAIHTKLKKGSNKGRSFIVESLGIRKPSSANDALALRSSGIIF